MEITFLGTGVAIPQKGRVQSGVLVRLEEKPLLIDCGSGVLSRFPEAGHFTYRSRHCIALTPSSGSCG